MAGGGDGGGDGDAEGGGSDGDAEGGGGDGDAEDVSVRSLFVQPSQYIDQVAVPSGGEEESAEEMLAQ